MSDLLCVIVVNATFKIVIMASMILRTVKIGVFMRVCENNV